MHRFVQKPMVQENLRPLFISQDEPAMPEEGTELGEEKEEGKEETPAEGDAAEEEEEEELPKEDTEV